jgi:subfamily B ATP-binding cassette protein MsbA
LAGRIIDNEISPKFKQGDFDGGIVAGFAYRFFPNPDMDRLEFARVAVPVAAIIFAFFRAIGFFVGQYFLSHVARNLVHDLRCELFNKMLFAPSSYYDKSTSGALISKITFNVDQLTGATTKALKTVIREGLLVIALMSYLIYLNWLLSLVFVAVVPFIALVVNVVGKHFRRYSRRIQSSMGDSEVKFVTLCYSSDSSMYILLLLQIQHQCLTTSLE